MKKRIGAFLLSLALCFSALPITYAAETNSSTAETLYDLGLFQGVGTSQDGKPNFDLARAPTRYEAVTMLVRLLGKNSEALNGNWTHPFTDVEAWANPYVGYAYAHGLASGSSPTTFSGNIIVTPAQYFTFTLRALGYSSGTDFSWDDPWRLSSQIGLNGGAYSAATAQFSRGDVAAVSYSALKCKLNQSENTLIGVLYDGGAVTADAVSAADLSDFVPSLTAKEITMYSQYTNVPDYASVTDDAPFYENGPQMAYRSVLVAEYETALKNMGFSADSEYREWYTDSKLNTKLAVISVYGNNAGRKVHVLSISDPLLYATVVFISIDTEIKKPLISESLAILIAGKKSYEKSDLIFQSDENQYRYGDADSIYGVTSYVSKARVTSKLDLQKFLQSKYNTLYSPMEDFDVTVEVWENSTASTGRSFNIHVDFSYVSPDNDVIIPTTFAEEYGYTSEQKEETFEQVKTMLQEIYQDTIDCFPDASVVGCIYVDSYAYPNLKLGFSKSTSLSWSNASGDFEWTPEQDSFTIY